MSSVTAWSTENQVLDTLKKLSNGKRQLGNLDDTYLVKGDMPPPALVEEDEEMRLRFGDSIPAAKDMHLHNSPPDLQGITNLLRLVKQSDEERGNEDTIEQQPNCVIAISKGSKLNPNVKEFIPKSSSISDVSVHSSENVEISDPTATDVKKETESVTEDLETKLKNHISYASKSNCFQLKKQRNVAIATLLRLYAIKNNEKPSDQKPAETLKLITPDYFENQNSPVTIQSEPNGTSFLPVSTSPGLKSMTSTSHTSSTSDVISEPVISTGVTAKKQKPEQDPAIKKSINKVNQWLGDQSVDETIQRKSPAVFMGPITYKPKEPSACKSPKIPDPEEQKITKTNQPNEYQPTNYAADLKNKYMDRVNSKKVTSGRNMWNDLHEILKEKDLAKKKLEQSSENSSDSDVPRRD